MTKKKFGFALFVVLALASIASALSTKTVTTNMASVDDGYGGRVFLQGFVADPTKAQTLGVGRTVVNHTTSVAWQLYTPANCKYRSMSTATIAGPLRTWLGGGPDVRLVHSKGAFTCYTSCTDGELDAMSK